MREGEPSNISAFPEPVFKRDKDHSGPTDLVSVFTRWWVIFNFTRDAIATVTYS